MFRKNGKETQNQADLEAHEVALARTLGAGCDPCFFAFLMQEAIILDKTDEPGGSETLPTQAQTVTCSELDSKPEDKGCLSFLINRKP